MVGNLSISSIAISVMALHVTLCPQNGNAAIAAHDHDRDGASSTTIAITSDSDSDNYGNKSQQQQQQQRQGHVEQNNHYLRRRRRIQTDTADGAADGAADDGADGADGADVDLRKSSVTNIMKQSTLQLNNVNAIHQSIKSETISRRLGSCLWHPDANNPGACTNDDNIPEKWIGMESTILHPTAEACCNDFFGGPDCVSYDTGLCGDDGGGGGDNGDVGGDDGGGDGDISSTSTSTSSSSLSCVSIGWHADYTTQGGCTDDDNYPEEWTSTAMMKSLMFYATPEGCCNSPIFMGQECSIRHSGCSNGGDDGGGDNDVDGDGDGDDGDDNGADETSSPSSSPSTTSDNNTTSPCVTPGWYTDLTHHTGCTNGDTYPDVYLSMNMKLLFYPTFEACCDAFFKGEECVPLDVGCVIDPTIGGGDDSGSDSGSESQQQQQPPSQQPPSPPPAPSCNQNEWHADTIRSGGCTNDLSYPPNWKTDSPHYFLPTAIECCRKYFSASDLTCQARDACNVGQSGGNGNGVVTTYQFTAPPTPNPTEPCMWHPSRNDHDGEVWCDYSSTYPTEWENWEGGINNLIYDSHEECCLGAHGVNECGKEFLGNCETPVPSPYPTATNRTITPTNSPTVMPSSSPTSVFYVSHSSGLCITESRVPRPYYITQTYADYDTCCQLGSTKKEMCIARGPTDAPTKFHPTISPKPTTARPTPLILYWVDHQTGLCKVGIGDAVPYYITQTYTDYDTCCQLGSTKKEMCIARGPRDPPPPTKSHPTISPRPATARPTPQIRYWVDHHTGICKVGTSRAVPFYVPETFSDHRTCCESSFKKELCDTKGGMNRPTNRPSGKESGVPSSSPSEMPSSVPSSVPSEPRGPTTPPTTFQWGALRAFSLKPTSRPTKWDCSDSFWHVDVEAPDNRGCTNYDIVDPPTTMTTMQNDALLLFQTAEACCVHSFEGADCPVRDNCEVSDSVISAEANVPRPEDSCDNWWHPDTEEGLDGCSNYEHFPSSWRLPKNKANLLFDTAIECCTHIYTERGDHCKIYNYCPTETENPAGNPTTTENPTKYPTLPPLTPQGFDISLTTDHPTKYLTPPLNPQGFDIPLTDHPTEQLRKYPTTTPSPQPIAPQLNPSTPMSGSPMPDDDVASSQSSCASAKWHIASDKVALACSNSLDYPEIWNDPSNSAQFLFDEHSDCCARYAPFDPGSCGRFDECVDVTTTTATTSSTGMTTTAAIGDSKDPEISGKSCRSGKWHMTLDFSKCSNNLEYPPSWPLFDRPTECCRSVFNYDDCDVEDICASEVETIHTDTNTQNPTKEPTPKPSTGTPTRGPTPNPTLEPSPKLSTGNPTHPPSPKNSAVYDNNDQCSGKTRRKCFSDPGCQYDQAGRICVKIVTTVQTSPEPITTSTGTPTRKPTLSPTLEPLPKPSTRTPTYEPTYEPTTRPTLEPSPMPSTRMPTRAPLQKISAVNDNHDHCSEKSRKTCFFDPGCQYDQASRICVKIQATSQINPKLVSTMGTPEPSAVSECGGKSRKQCIKDPECDWDKSETSCAQLGAVLVDVPDNQGDTTDTITTAKASETTTSASQNCDEMRWHPKTITDRTCSNSHDYPPLWDNPPYSEQYLFKSFNQCCEVFYDGMCSQEDVCNTIASR